MNEKTKELNKQNNILDKKISEENQKIFTDMICYLRGADISDYDIEVVRQDLTEMVLSAQERGEDISKLVRGDYEQFCDEIIENLPPKSIKQKIIDVADVMCRCFTILFALGIIASKDTVGIIRALAKKSEVDWNISVSVGWLLSCFLIIACSVAIVNWITKNAFKREKKIGKVFILTYLAVFVVVLLLTIMLSATLFKVNIFIALASVGLAFVAHKILASI